MNMNVLDSPLEALAVDYLSLGLLTIVNNLWTWVAVITAAVSFWRIRAAGATSASCLKADSPPPCYDQSSNGVPDSTDDDEPQSPVSVSASNSGLEVEDVKADGVTKGMKFFAVYYEEEEDGGEGDGELTAKNDWEESGVDGVKGDGEWWERVLRMRTGEMGWYRYQDLTELNGNIVRLWDGCSTRELKYSSSCCVVW
ncbi:hypothetical protein FCV25MIE_31745 [Fagus crenata]